MKVFKPLKIPTPIYIVYNLHWFVSGKYWEMPYIGLCTTDELSTLADANQNSSVRDLIDLNRSDEAIRIEPVLITADRPAAVAMREILITTRKPQPHCNLHGSVLPPVTRGVRGMPVRNLETGETYESAAAAARALGVTHGAVAHHLAGRMPTVAGTRLARSSDPAPTLPDDYNPLWR